MKLKINIYIAFAIMLSVFATAQQKEPIPLYSTIPNSKPAPADYKEYTDEHNLVRNVVTPTLLPYFPEKGKANGAAVIVCPGGGYAVLAFNHEGKDVARRFAENGVTAFVLKYRLPSDKIMQDRSIGPLQDAQRALQLVHEHATEWGIDPNKIGILGFSAGGHLAATATTHYNKPVILVTDSLSIKPDFSILVYPVISMGEFTHQGSKEFLIGKDAPQQTIDAFSNEKQVKPDMCPTFLVHSEDDGLVPIQNALLFYGAMVDNKVKGVLDTYQSGGHGYGMNNRTTTEDWFENCLKWLKQNKVL